MIDNSKINFFIFSDSSLSFQLATRWPTSDTSGMMVWTLFKSLGTSHCHNSKCSDTVRRLLRPVCLQVTRTEDWATPRHGHQENNDETPQETTPVWLVRFNLWGQWDTTSSRSTFLPRWSSSSPGSPSGSTEAPPRPGWGWGWPLSSPWPPSSPPLTLRFPKYPTLSLLTCIWPPVSSWCSPPC